MMLIFLRLIICVLICFSSSIQANTKKSNQQFAEYLEIVHHDFKFYFNAAQNKTNSMILLHLGVMADLFEMAMTLERTEFLSAVQAMLIERKGSKHKSCWTHLQQESTRIKLSFTQQLKYCGSQQFFSRTDETVTHWMTEALDMYDTAVGDMDTYGRLGLGFYERAHRWMADGLDVVENSLIELNNGKENMKLGMRFFMTAKINWKD